MPKVGVEPVRRDQIRRAAAKVVAEHGFERATLLMVAKEAKVSTGMINHYYDNRKLELLKDTLIYVSDWFQDRLRRALDQETEPSRRLEILIAGALDFDSEEAMIGQKVWLWALAAAIGEPEVAEVIMERRRLFQEIIRGVLRDADMQARLGPDDLHRLAAEYDAYLNGLCIHLLTGEANLEDGSVRRSLRSMALSRLRAPPSALLSGAAQEAWRPEGEGRQSASRPISPVSRT